MNGRDNIFFFRFDFSISFPSTTTSHSGNDSSIKVSVTYPVFPANNTSIFIHLNKVKYNKIIFSFQYQYLYRK